jgi:hypothetical protein
MSSQSVLAVSTQSQCSTRSIEDGWFFDARSLSELENKFFFEIWRPNIVGSEGGFSQNIFVTIKVVLAHLSAEHLSSPARVVDAGDN